MTKGSFYLSLLSDMALVRVEGLVCVRLHHSLFLGLFPDIIFKCELHAGLSFTLFPFPPPV